MDQNELFESLCRMNQIRYYQLRMMEAEKESVEREVYRDVIRGLIAENENIPVSNVGEHAQG